VQISCIKRFQNLDYRIESSLHMHPIRIENDAIRMDVWPQFGGKVSSIVDKADHFDLLFSYPMELPEGPSYDTAYVDHWYCGWDECFPTVGACAYPNHPYGNVPVPDHGELWGIPTSSAVPARDGITTVWHGLRFGYQLTRTLHLEDASIVAEYSLTNLSPFEFRFVWAQHALMSMNVPVELGAGEARHFRLSHNAQGEVIDKEYLWPNEPGGEDLSHLVGLPAKQGWKSFSAAPIESEWEIRYPSRDRSVRISYSSVDGLQAFWGVWIGTGGWGGHNHFAIEATTGCYDQVDRSIRDDSAGRVTGFGRREWATKWVLA
jgi:hypothetical protein